MIRSGSKPIHATIAQDRDRARLNPRFREVGPCRWLDRGWPGPCLEEDTVTTPKQSNTEWVRCYYDAFNRRDWEWIAAMLAPDVEWFHASRDERVRGTNAVIACFRSLVEGTPSAQIEVRAIHDAGPVIIAECGIRHVQKRISSPPPLRGASSSNRPPPIEPATFCEILEVKGGRCSRGTTYADSVRLLMDINQAAAA